MTQTIKAIYQNGVLRPLEPLADVPENSPVEITVSTPQQPRHPLMDCFGILPDEDAKEMLAIIEEEFEKVDPDDWK